MTDAEVPEAKRREWEASIQQGRDWAMQAISAQNNAFLWLSQSDTGEIPHGDATCLALTADQALTKKPEPPDSGSASTATPPTSPQ